MNNIVCSNCGKRADPNDQFCSACGMKLDSKPLTSPAPENSIPSSDSLSSTPQVKKKSMPFWYKLAALLTVLALMGVTAGILFTETWVDAVDHQLEALRVHDIPKAYHTYTSNEFQSTTSLDQFRNFIESYPVFLNNQSAHFSQRSIEHHIGTLKGNLTSNDHINTPIEYKLIKEDNKWKILSIRLLKPEKIPSAPLLSDGGDLTETVKSQLKELQDQKLVQAYQNHSSIEFKEATPEDAFTAFIQRYPILSQHDVVTFHTPTFHHGVGTLSVILQSDQMAAYLKYYLINEDGKWKIWSMRILSRSEIKGT